MTRATRAARCASELRIVIGQVVRRLRLENTFPLSQATVRSRLEREGAATTSALAVTEHVRPQSMAQTIGELHEEGLVTRSPDPADRRQVLIEITDLGRQKLTEDRRRREGWLAEAISSELTPEEQGALMHAIPLLQRLVGR